MIPSNFTLKINPKAKRFSVENVRLILRCMCGLEGAKRPMTIGHKTAPQGEAGSRWMEASAEGYTMAFLVHDLLSTPKGGSIYECVFCKTPKDSEYWQETDGGSVFGGFSHNEVEAITNALYVGYKPDDCEVLVAQLWRVAIRATKGGIVFVGGAFDHGTIDGIPFPKELLNHASFASKLEAEKVAAEYKVYRKAMIEDQRRIISQSTDKAPKTKKDK